MSLSICGLGTATPDLSIKQEDAAEIAKSFVYGDEENAQLLPKLYRLSLVRRRGSVLLEESKGGGPRQSFYPAATAVGDRGPTTQARMQRFTAEALPLALAASHRALGRAGIAPNEITHLITVSCTGFEAPGVDVGLIRQLGMSPSVARLHVGFMGCHGAINAMRAAQAFVEADANACVLLCCVELCSLHYFYGWDPEKIVANALFADGAAALVARATPGDGSEGWSVAATDSYLLPDTEDDMGWRIGDFGFEMNLSARVPSLLNEHLRPWLVGWLKTQGLTIDDLNSWAIHPGGPRIIRSVSRALELPPEATKVSNCVLTEHGNMSSATVLFVIEQLQRTAAELPCVSMAFGPGLIVEAALLR